MTFFLFFFHIGILWSCCDFRNIIAIQHCWLLVQNPILLFLIGNCSYQIWCCNINTQELLAIKHCSFLPQIAHSYICQVEIDSNAADFCTSHMITSNWLSLASWYSYCHTSKDERNIDVHKWHPNGKKHQNIEICNSNPTAHSSQSKLFPIQNGN